MQGPVEQMKLKSIYSLWGPLEINGQKKWGVNEIRPYGLYTIGPHDGYFHRKEAAEALRTLRQRERDDEFQRKMMNDCLHDS